VGLFIPVYVLAVSLAALTIGWAASLAKNSGRKLHQLFFFFVAVNDLVSLSDVLFRFLPARVGPVRAVVGPLVSGFLNFPLMAAFSYLTIAVLLELAGFAFPKTLKRIYAVYWGLLFCGFLVAEVRHIVDKDLRLTNQLMPFFNAAIIVSGLGASLFVFLHGGVIQDLRERRFVRRMSAYFFAAFVIFGLLFYGPLHFDPALRVLGRSLLGFAYLFPLLAWFQARFRETKDAPLTILAGGGDVLERWLEGRRLSPRERQIARFVLEGKSNKTIEQELYIGKRTVESHLYSIYQKLGVKNRLQLARLAAAEAEKREN
jgi:DNA-binding CsgD family transcriptional regulator